MFASFRFQNSRLFFLFTGLLTSLLLAFGTTSLFAQPRDFGADVSHYQGASGVSQSAWNQMVAEGKKFTFIKATEGLTGPDDAAMANNVARATTAGLLVGVYHYPHPENRPTTNGAIQEADHFLGYAGTAIGPGRLRPVLDVEGSSANLTVADLTAWIIAFSDRIISQRGIAAAPIIYMNRSFARDEVDSRLANYEMWLAYPTTVDVSTAAPPPTVSYPKPTGVFNNWVFWQYSTTGSAGGISPLDLDVCHNEYKSLASFLIPFPPIVLNFARLGNGATQIIFTNTPGRAFTVVATTNLSLSLSNWPSLGPVTETAPGNFQFTDASATNQPQRFYRVRSP